MQEAIHIAEDKIHDYIDDIKEIVQEEKSECQCKREHRLQKDIEAPFGCHVLFKSDEGSAFADL